MVDNGPCPMINSSIRNMNPLTKKAYQNNANMGFVAENLSSGGSEKVRLKSVCSVTENS